jgi:hypothetical protein
VLGNRVGNLLQVQSIDRARISVTLNGTPGSTVEMDQNRHPLLRRWDYKSWDYKKGEPAEGGLELGNDGAALIVEGRWLNLESGIQVWFQPFDVEKQPSRYRTGDCWLIPVRTATGNVEWPSVKDAKGRMISVAVPPDGVAHHYAPLALITVGGDGVVTVVEPECRRNFDSIVDLTAR